MAYCTNYKGHKPFSLLHQRGHHPFSPFTTVSTLSSFSLLLSFSLPLPLTKTISYLRLDRTFSCFFIMLVPILQEVNVYFLEKNVAFFLCILLEGMLPLSLFLFSVSFWSSVSLIVVCGCGCGCGCGCVRMWLWLWLWLWL